MYWKLEQDPNWRPYCLRCPSMLRMIPMPYGFWCAACDNHIDRDMHRIEKPQCS